MQIILLAGGVKFPGRSREDTEPIIRCPTLVAVPPEVIVPIGAGRIGPAVNKPGVFIGTVVNH